MRKKVKEFIICVAIPLLVGAVSGFMTSGGMRNFAALNQPALSPPAWLFPVVWTVLYVLMGIASYLVLTSDKSQENIWTALTIYGYQLTANFLWPVFFFPQLTYSANRLY